MSTPAVGEHADVLIRVEPDVRSFVDRSLLRRLKRRAARMLRSTGLQDVELSVLLAGDATVAELNQSYRDKAGTTDVLSFGQATPDELERWHRRARHSERVLERVLGDVVISLQVVKRRSRTPARFEADLVDLLAHGVLHLLGQDHPDAGARETMLARQARLVEVALARGRVAFVGF